MLRTHPPATEHLPLLEASSKVPKGIVCLLSAPQFHEFTTQSPRQVWMASDVKAWSPPPAPSTTMSHNFRLPIIKSIRCIKRIRAMACLVVDCLEY